MKRIALALALFAVACGDNNEGQDTPDARPNVDGAPVDMEEPAKPRAVVTAGDFANAGLLSAFDLETRTATTDVAPATAVGNDPMLRKVGNELFVVNRTSNNVTILNANDYTLVEQISTGANSNPHDVAVDGNKLFVTAYGGTGIVELTRGSTTITPISLAAGDADGKPNCESIYKVGTRLFVTCQLLDDANQLANRGTPGKVYVIDIATRAIQHELDLDTSNPLSFLEQLPNGDLVVGTVDFRFGNNNAGCIERITTGATPVAEGCMINNTSFAGGFAGRLAVGTDKLYALVSRADFSGGDVRTITLAGSTLDTGAYTKADQDTYDIAVCPNGNLVTAENPRFGAPANAPQGFRLYTGAMTEATTTAVSAGLKPASTHGLACY